MDYVELTKLGFHHHLLLGLVEVYVRRFIPRECVIPILEESSPIQLWPSRLISSHPQSIALLRPPPYNISMFHDMYVPRRLILLHLPILIHQQARLLLVLLDSSLPESSIIHLKHLLLRGFRGEVLCPYHCFILSVDGVTGREDFRGFNRLDTIVRINLLLD